MAETGLLASVTIKAALAEAGPPFDDDAALSLEERPVAFDGAGDVEIRGIVSLPGEGAPGREAAPGTGLVLVHGWGTSRVGPARLLVRMARRAALTGTGLISLRFDLPGRGESGGEYASVDIDGMIDATLAAVGFLKKEGVEKVFLAGLCSGANIALGAGGLSAGSVAGVLAMSALPYQEERRAGMRLRRSLGYIKGYLKKALSFSTWRRLFRGEVDLGGVTKTISAKDGRVSGGRNLKKSVHDLPKAVSSFPGKVVLVWGEKDPEAPASRRYFEKLFARTSKPADIYIIGGANHNYYGLPPQHEVFGVLDGLISGTGEADPVG